MRLCKVTGKELSEEKVYSQADVSDFMAKFFKRALSGDSLSGGTPWGPEENKRLYIAVFSLLDSDYGIDSPRVPPGLGLRN